MTTRKPDSLLSLRGRLGRGRFWLQVLGAMLAFGMAFWAIDTLLGRSATWVLYPLIWWLGIRLGVRRYHDLGRSGAWLLMAAIPLLGIAVVAIELFLRGSERGDNRFGPDPRAAAPGYHVVR